MERGWLVVCVIFAVVACATTSPPTADTAVDWKAVAQETVPAIVTQDPDGGERVTKLWLAVVDGQGLIRTADTKWFHNIQRAPDVVFRVGGRAYPLRAELVTDASLKERAEAAFREKYGWQDWLIHLLRGPDLNLMRLTPRE